MIKQYTDAVTTLLLEGHDPKMVIENLKDVMQKRGHASLLRKVLRGVLQKTEKHEHNALAKVIVANRESYTSQKEEVSAALDTLAYKKDKEVVLLEVNPRITGGYIATYNNKQIDNSYKQKLSTLYRSIIKD